MTEIDTLLNAGNSPSQLARLMVRYLRNALMAKLGGESTELLQISADERARVARTAMLFSEEDLTRFLQIMLRTFDEMNYRQEPRFHLELGLFKLVHTQRLIPLEQLMSQLPGSGTAPRSSATPGRAASASMPPRASAPRSVASSEVSRGTAATSSVPTQPAQPTFSPFESDTRRKSGPSGSALPQEAVVGAPPRTGVAVALQEPTPAPISEEIQNGHHEPPEPQIRGHVSPEAERIAADLEEELASDDLPEPPASSEFVSLTDKLRDAVTQALYDKGLETASTLLRGGQWMISEDTVTVEVAVGKAMLAITINAEAERTARTALQHAGSNLKLVVRPGEGGGSPVPPVSSVAKGGLQAHALQNPLVKRAQELFRAEVRDVLDLRRRS